jgi:hypothetical protein
VLAEHFARGGLPERAVDGYLLAARDALEGNDMATVLARVERGLAKVTYRYSRPPDNIPPCKIRIK